MSRSAAILKNTVANYVRQITAVGIFLFLTPYTAHRLGTEQFGLWSLMWAMVGVLALIDMGVSNAVVKFVADARGRADDARVSQLCSTFFWLENGLAICVVLVAAALVPFLNAIFDIPPQFSRTAAIVFGILSFRVASGMPLGLFAGLLSAHRRQADANLIKAAGIVVYGAFVFLILRYEPTAVSLAIANITVHLLTNAFIVIQACRQVPNFSIRPRDFQKGLVREISRFSGAAFLVRVSSLLYTRVDTFIIQRVLSLAAVARYSVAMQTISRGTEFCHQLSSAITPMVAELKGANDERAIRTLLRKATKLNAALTTPLLGGLIWLTADLVESWMGAEFAESVLPMRLLAAAAWVDSAMSISANVLIMTGRQMRMARLTIVSQVFNLVVTLLLVKPLGIGGVALASLMATVLHALVTAIETSRYAHIRIRDAYGPVLTSAIPLALMFLAMAGCRKALDAVGVESITLFHVGLLQAAGCAVFFAAFYCFGCSAKERAYYLKTAGKLTSRLRKRKP